MINNEDFLYIEDCKNDIDRIIKDVNVKCENIEQIYKEYIKEAVSKEEFVSTLDKMLFQIEITRQDTENCIELYRMFIYKIYGQYYKFYIKIINILQNLDSFDFLKEIQIKNFIGVIDIFRNPRTRIFIIQGYFVVIFFYNYRYFSSVKPLFTTKNLNRINYQVIKQSI